jgi:hypothetical protein
MWFTSWLRNLKRSGPDKRLPTYSCPSQRATFRPRLEALEDRWLPSTLKVTNLLDSGPGSLRYEIAQAQSNDTIVFDFGNKKANSTPHTITLTSGELDINKNLTIQGPGAGLLTITSQSWVDMAFESHKGSRIFEVDGANTAVAISGLTLTNGGGTRLGGGVSVDFNDGFGGAILNFGTLTISTCTLGGSTAPAGEGGAIANFGTMTVSGCYVQNNDAEEGGGIYNAGTLTVSSSYVWHNWGDWGGGIYNAGTATVSGCALSSNKAVGGGGIYNAASGALTLDDSTVLSNVAPLGADLYNLGSATLNDSTVGVIGP